MARKSDRCRRCQREADAERVREKRSYIASCWAMGMTMTEIAAGLDTTMRTVAMEIQRMRRLGMDVPNRQPSRMTAPRPPP
jgi:DNA-binding NarL/FixJ family response regulator